MASLTETGTAAVGAVGAGGGGDRSASSARNASNTSNSSNSTATHPIIGTGRYATIEEVLNAHHLAAARGHLEDFFGCFHVQGNYLGTDVSENWKVEEFIDFCRPYFGRPKGAWTFTPIPGTRKFILFPDEATASFATFDEQMMSADFKVTTRGTGTVVRVRETDGSSYWLILSYHLSFNVPNDIAKDLCKQIEKYESNQNMAAKHAAADAAAAELIAELGGKGKGKSKSKKK
jgi:hypothetical protein